MIFFIYKLAKNRFLLDDLTYQAFWMLLLNKFQRRWVILSPFASKLCRMRTRQRSVRYGRLLSWSREISNTDLIGLKPACFIDLKIRKTVMSCLGMCEACILTFCNKRILDLKLDSKIRLLLLTCCHCLWFDIEVIQFTTLICTLLGSICLEIHFSERV